MEIVNIPMGSVIPYPLNAKDHPEAQIQQIIDSVLEFGFYNPIHVSPSSADPQKFDLIAGEGRFTAMGRLGKKVIPAIIHSHLSERQIKALRLADNKIQMNSGWKLDQLQNSISELIELDYNLELAGFDEQELDGLLGDIEILPEKTKKTISVGSYERSATLEPKKKPNKKEQREVYAGQRWELGGLILEVVNEPDPDLINSLLDFFEARSGENAVEI